MERNLELETAAFGNLDDLDNWRVYADWLLSHGDARGEIASLAVHLGEAFLSERKAMAARMDELEQPFVDAWHAWARGRDLLDVEVEFKRGFAHAVTGSLTQMNAALDELFERDPIQRLTLTHVEPDTLARLFERNPAWFRRLRYLKLIGTLDETAAAALASVDLGQLQRLNLLGLGIGAAECGRLAGLRTRTLESLTLSANEIDEAGVEALLGSPTRAQWRELYLSSNPIDANALARLAADRTLALTGLYLRQIDADLGDFAPFTDPSVLPTLIHLEVPSYGYWQHKGVHEQLVQRLGDGLRLR